MQSVSTSSRSAILMLQVRTEAEKDTYDWAKQWYPLAFVEDLDPKIPHPMELLGERLVLWRDADQQWRCFQDKCPHRLAPLSGVSLVMLTTDLHEMHRLAGPSAMTGAPSMCGGHS